MKGIRRSLREKIAHLRVLAGDADAFGYFYDRYAPKIYRFVLLKTSSQELAQDITHDVFLAAWEQTMKDKKIGNFQAFLFTLARNKISDYYRDKERQTTLLEASTEAESLTSQPTKVDPSDINQLQKQVLKLKAEYQEVVLLRHVEGLSIEEISLILGKDKNSVRVTLHRAIAKLRSFYKKEDDTPAKEN